ncbi:SPOR domain-containing protein [Ornithobacterium rhinotracheale]|uniref:SPOR domain-containing protein n=1 Tax=Ornithobacterium rhinotracheale TaxID=28251 RepID=UPI00129CCEED|nr:SPOR domain-containing protein [Ornithobacterium rhinotracheale]MRJ07872.1 SPOR domain-containing protein [Ornithobacterium rhinotracheale]MRJ10868.1 SPOR domain-containing protein [Ornithobacterium rhinotracheale]UOH78614.1 SPOR domain-containing protein [Ornithobacterium rhinotracheale]
MKKIFSLLIGLILSTTFAQISVKDSVSGGGYTIDVNHAIDSLIAKDARAKCWKASQKASNAEILKKEDENIDICARSPKVKGYRIQIRYTKDRSLANSVLNEFNRNFPDLSSEMVYTRPDYRVLVGEYFTKRSAAADMSRIKKKYPGAFFVQWAVWCRRAK